MERYDYLGEIKVMLDHLPEDLVPAVWAAVRYIFLNGSSFDSGDGVGD